MRDHRICALRDLFSVIHVAVFTELNRYKWVGGGGFICMNPVICAHQVARGDEDVPKVR